MEEPRTTETAPLADDLAWSPEDVLQLYGLVLNRSVESREMLEEMALWDDRRRIGSFFHSPEFRDTVGARLQAGEPPRDAAPPSIALAQWAARRMPLSPEGRERTAGSAQSWSRLYHALAADPVFRTFMDPDSPLTEPRAFATLTTAAGIEGRLEEASAGRARGWAIRPDSPDDSVTVEIWINGRFCCAAPTDDFRRDVQDRFGGAGLAGFDIVIPASVRARFSAMEMELRSTPDGFVLGRASVSSEAAPPGLLAELRRDMSEAHRLLQALESRLPHLETGLSTPLDDYDAYSRAWRAAGPAPAVSSLSFDVVLDIADASPRHAEEAARAAADQTHAERGLVLVAAPGQTALATDLLRRLDWSLPGARARLCVTDAVDPARRLLAALDLVDGDLVLPLTADVVLEPSALARLAARFDRSVDVQAVYMDEDVFVADDDEAPPTARRRQTPRLKPAFDADYLIQTPYVGELIAFRRDALADLGLRPQAGPHMMCDALLRAAPQAVDHVGRVLAARRLPEPTNPAIWRACAEHRIHSMATRAEIQTRDDILGARTQALRVRHAPPADASACVIIPTRDGLDLLKPCIDSLLDRRADNRTPFEILVIDHESREQATRDYLKDLTARGDARVLPYVGDFNWALMNNLAAAETQAKALIFLNNDTLALSRDWLDELVAQALRPEIGVAGCRLIYGDGTIQHAGFVNREETYAFLCHEGVGADGAEPGYLDRHVVVHATAAVTGACMAVQAETFRALGGFAPGFPVEGNDVDLCLRARDRGLIVLYTPDATLYHLESKTRGFNHDRARQETAEAASRIIWKRWGERFSRDPGFNPHFDRMSRPFARLRPPPPWAG